MIDQSFDKKAWEERLSSALQTLWSTQGPFLEEYWRLNGQPARHSYNGHDETPFPSNDLYDLYEFARHAKQFENAEYYGPLRASLDPVRGVLRSHPTLARVLGLKIGNENFHVGILNGSSWTCLSHLISGQMARREKRGERSFDNSVAELNSLLLKSAEKLSSPLEGDLDLGFDVVLFHGAEIEDCVELGEGYWLMPFSHLDEFVDGEIFEDIAPDQVKHRDLRMIFGIVRKFRWTPDILPMNAMSKRPHRHPLPLFQRWAMEFANLLSVYLGKPIICMLVLEGCVSKVTCGLLGTTHNFSGMRRGRFVGHFYDPFRKERPVDIQSIKIASLLFAKRRDTAYPELAPVVLRLAEALSRDGRHAAHDKVLDLAIALERLFKPPPKKSISSFLQNTVADLLGSDKNNREKLNREVKHFYDVRSAIVHGPKDDRKTRLLRETEEAFKNGFRIAQQSLIKKLS